MIQTMKTYACVAVKDVYVFAGVEIIDGTLSVDLESVYEVILEPSPERLRGRGTYARPS